MDKSLWDANEEENKPLRRPNSSSDPKTNQIKEEANISENIQRPAQSVNQYKEVVNKSNNFNDILNKSNLSAEAKEWFPSSYNRVGSQLAQPAQNRLQRIKYGSSAGEDSDTETSHNTIAFDVAHLDVLIKSLIYDPGQFDHLVDNFVAILAPHFNNIDVSNQTAEAIFDYAVKEPSFRYNAARLCSTLDAHYPLFRPQLHMLCEKELYADKQRQGLTLFLAELFVQLDYETVYGRCVVDSIQMLLSSNKPEDIKSACQALKLAGYSLESTNAEALDQIFTLLETTKPILQQPLSTLVDSVITLRKNNWGRSTNPVINNNSSQEQNGVITSSSDEEFVLYGPDGQEITQEEQEFLYSNFGDDADYLGDESSDPDDLYNPEPEMDKEIQEAFREFVKLSKR